jgi:hypothetical protein
MDASLVLRASFSGWESIECLWQILMRLESAQSRILCVFDIVSGTPGCVFQWIDPCVLRECSRLFHQPSELRRESAFFTPPRTLPHRTAVMTTVTTHSLSKRVAHHHFTSPLDSVSDHSSNTLLSLSTCFESAFIRRFPLHIKLLPTPSSRYRHYWSIHHHQHPTLR